MALTDTAIKALKPKAKPYTVDRRAGLGAGGVPTGGMLWHFATALNGRQERVTSGDIRR